MSLGNHAWAYMCVCGDKYTYYTYICIIYVFMNVCMCHKGVVFQTIKSFVCP